MAGTDFTATIKELSENINALFGLMDEETRASEINFSLAAVVSYYLYQNAEKSDSPDLITLNLSELLRDRMSDATLNMQMSKSMAAIQTNIKSLLAKQAN